MFGNICIEIAKKESRHSAAGNALTCAAITLVFVFWRFEGYLSPSIMSLMTKGAALLMIFCWFSMSFSSGLLERCSFAIFTALFWNIPSVVCLWADSMTPRSFNSALYLAGEYSRLLVPYSLGGLPIFSSMDYVTSAAVFSGVCLIIYISGMLSLKARTLPDSKSNV